MKPNKRARQAAPRCQSREPSECGMCGPERLRYRCRRCKRLIPWCIGGTDSTHCDDCWIDLQTGFR
jgi:hypothetical protein